MNRFARLIRADKAVLFGVVSLWVCLEYIALGPYSYLQISDTADAVVPRYLALKADVFKHGVTYWFPYMAGGVDRLAQDSSYAHGVEILFLILPGWFAYALTMLGLSFLAGYFTYRIAREHLGLPEWGSVFAGVALALLPFAAIVFQSAYALFPLSVWALNRLFSAGLSFRRSIAYVIPMAVLYSACSSIVFTLPFTLTFVLLWLIFVNHRRNVESLLVLAVFCLVAVVWQAPAIWSLLLNASTSQRTSWPLTGTSFQLDNPGLLLNVAMDTISIYFHPLNKFYHSLFVPLIAVALVFLRFRDRRFNTVLAFLLLTTAGNVLIAIGRALLYEDISFFRGFQFTRFYNMAHIFSPLSAAYGLEKIPESATYVFRGRTIRVGHVVLMFAFGALGYQSLIFKKDNFVDWLANGASYRSAFHSRQLEGLVGAGRETTKPFRVATVASPQGSLHPGYATAFGLETADGYMNLYPRRYQDFWLKVVEPDAEFHDYIRYWGNRLHLFPPQSRQLYQPIQFRDHYSLNLLSLVNTRYVLSASELPIGDPDLIPVASVAEPASLSLWDRAVFKLRERLITSRGTNLREQKSTGPSFSGQGISNVSTRARSPGCALQS